MTNLTMKYHKVLNCKILFGIIAAVCRFGKIENGCVFNCNCQSDSKCNSNIGCEVGSCQKDIPSGGPFSGQGCQIGRAFVRHSCIVLLYTCM